MTGISEQISDISRLPLHRTLFQLLLNKRHGHYLPSPSASPNFRPVSEKLSDRFSISSLSFPSRGHPVAPRFFFLTLQAGGIYGSRTVAVKKRYPNSAVGKARSAETPTVIEELRRGRNMQVRFRKCDDLLVESCSEGWASPQMKIGHAVK